MNRVNRRVPLQAKDTWWPGRFHHRGAFTGVRSYSASMVIYNDFWIIGFLYLELLGAYNTYDPYFWFIISMIRFSMAAGGPWIFGGTLSEHGVGRWIHHMGLGSWPDKGGQIFERQQASQNSRWMAGCNPQRDLISHFLIRHGWLRLLILDAAVDLSSIGIIWQLRCRTTDGTAPGKLGNGLGGIGAGWRVIYQAW